MTIYIHYMLVIALPFAVLAFIHFFFWVAGAPITSPETKAVAGGLSLIIGGFCGAILLVEGDKSGLGHIYIGQPKTKEGK